MGCLLLYIKYLLQMCLKSLLYALPLLSSGLLCKAPLRKDPNMQVQNRNRNRHRNFFWKSLFFFLLLGNFLRKSLFSSFRKLLLEIFFLLSRNFFWKSLFFFLLLGNFLRKSLFFLTSVSPTFLMKNRFFFFGIIFLRNYLFFIV